MSTPVRKNAVVPLASMGADPTPLRLYKYRHFAIGFLTQEKTGLVPSSSVNYSPLSLLGTTLTQREARVVSTRVVVCVRHGEPGRGAPPGHGRHSFGRGHAGLLQPPDLRVPRRRVDLPAAPLRRRRRVPRRVTLRHKLGRPGHAGVFAGSLRSCRRVRRVDGEFAG